MLETAQVVPSARALQATQVAAALGCTPTGDLAQCQTAAATLGYNNALTLASTRRLADPLYYPFSANHGALQTQFPINAEAFRARVQRAALMQSAMTPATSVTQSSDAMIRSRRCNCGM